MHAPLVLENHTASNTIELTWDDGSRQLFQAADLRRECQCADCKSLRRHSGEPSIPDDVGIHEIRLIGTYAVQFLFTDGHERGIYPWTYLKNLVL
jgi:DUF971 family protein